MIYTRESRERRDAAFGSTTGRGETGGGGVPRDGEEVLSVDERMIEEKSTPSSCWTVRLTPDTSIPHLPAVARPDARDERL
ncbi:unnamed protein product [Lota lota]